MTTLEIRQDELNRMNQISSVSSNRDCEFFLIHESRDTFGPFKRIVAGSNHKTPRASGEAMARFGCLPDRPNHKLIKSSEITDKHNFATFYTCYT